jgi:hypothetical protein
MRTVTEIDDPEHIIARDMANRVSELHQRWFKDATGLMVAAELSYPLLMRIIAGELMLRTARIIALSEQDAEDMGKVLVEVITKARAEPKLDNPLLTIFQDWT